MPKTIAADPRRDECEPAPVQHRLLAPVRRCAADCGGGREQAARQQQPDDPDRQVHEEDPAPRQVLDDRAADDGAEHRCEQHRHADDAHHAAHAARARGLSQGDHPDRHDHAAGEALEHAEADQRLGAPGQAAEAAGHDERRHGGHPHPLRAEALGGPPGQRDRGREREQVAGAHPLDRRQRRVQLDPQGLQRHVHDRRVEDRHDGADDHHDRDPADVAGQGVVQAARSVRVADDRPRNHVLKTPAPVIDQDQQVAAKNGIAAAIMAGDAQERAARRETLARDGRHPYPQCTHSRRLAGE